MNGQHERDATSEPGLEELLGLPAPTLVDVPGGPLATLDLAPPADAHPPLGRPVVLVPGYTGSKEDFALLLPALAAAGHRGVAYDQRGQFQSPGPVEGRFAAAYQIPALAEDLLALIATLGPAPAHLVGHSFGGLVARAAVLTDPAAVASLTLLDSGPGGLPDGPRVTRIETLRPLLPQGMAAVWAEIEAGAAEHDPKLAAAPAVLREFLRRRFLASSALGLEAMGEELLAAPDRTVELADRGVPVLVAYGEDDDAWPPSVQADMAARLHARRVVVPRSAHSPAMENPDATAAALLDFLATVEPG